MSNDKEIIKFELVYEGEAADAHLIDLYDVSQALIGFQKSIALTCHLIINREIITQARSLKGAQILTNPSDEGSWKIVVVVLTSAYMIGTAPKETPLGHVVYSVYDYIISGSLGFPVDYDNTLGKSLDEYNKKNPNKIKIEQHQLDSLKDKCNTAFTDIHRPIVKTKTAKTGKINSFIGGEKNEVGPSFNIKTYQYIHEATEIRGRISNQYMPEYLNEEAEIIRGRISSYNSNTYKGSIYVAKEGRPIAFELEKSCRDDNVVRVITASLAANAVKSYDNEWIEVCCKVLKYTTRNGGLKSYKVIDVRH